MEERTRQALLELNRRFYQSSAASFDATRQRPWRGWQRLLPKIPDSGPLRILDAGCGNARFGRFLAENLTQAIDYTGVDSSAGLLQAASTRLAGSIDDPTLIQSDLEAWLEFDGAGYHEAGGFDLIVLFGVLHHMPGSANRRRVLEALASLLRPRGQLIATWWMLHLSPRFQKKTVRWSVGAEIDTSELETGDTLLAWQGQSVHPRYCHFPSTAELHRHRALPNLVLEEEFREDGPSGEDNLYRAYRRAS